MALLTLAPSDHSQTVEIHSPTPCNNPFPRHGALPNILTRLKMHRSVPLARFSGSDLVLPLNSGQKLHFVNERVK